MTKNIKELLTEISTKKAEINNLGGLDKNSKISDTLKSLEDKVKTAQKTRDKASTAVRSSSFSARINKVISGEKVIETAQEVKGKTESELSQAEEALKSAKETLSKAKSQKAELDKLETEYKQLEAEGEKILKSEEAKFLKKIIQTQTVNAINGKTESIQAVVSTINIPNLQNKLTENQINRLNTLKEGLEGKTNDSQELITKFATAIKNEVDKGVAALKTSKAYREVEGQLDHYIKRQLIGANDKYNSSEIETLNKLRNSIELSIKNGDLEWKVKEDVKSMKDRASGIAKKLNDELKSEKGPLKGFEDEFKSLVDKVQQSPEVQSAWKMLIEAIKNLFKGNFEEAGKNFKESLEVAVKKDPIKDIISKHNKEQTNAEKAKESKLSKGTSQQL